MRGEDPRRDENGLLPIQWDDKVFEKVADAMPWIQQHKQAKRIEFEITILFF